VSLTPSAYSISDDVAEADLPSSSDHREPSELRYVVIEGCIGVGKTTLTHLLANRFSARMIGEVVEENPFLPEFYEDPKAHAFKTQMFFLLSRFKQQEEIIQGDLFSSTVVSDYLFAKDRIFAELTLNDSEMALYDQVFSALESKVKTPDLVIYLQAPLDVILKRIEKRGRIFERDMDPGYLERLVEAYGRYFSRFEACPLLIVDTEELNFPEREEDLSALLAAAEETHRDGHPRRMLSGRERQPKLL
jgi:deoxyadenosine/deoxycytidine kinase